MAAFPYLGRALHGGDGQPTVCQWPPPPYGEGKGPRAREAVLDLRPSDRPFAAQPAPMPGRGRRGGAGIPGGLPIPGVQLPACSPLLQCVAQHEARRCRSRGAVGYRVAWRRGNTATVVRHGACRTGGDSPRQSSRVAAASRAVDRLVKASKGRARSCQVQSFQH